MGSDLCFIRSLGLTPNFENGCTRCLTHFCHGLLVKTPLCSRAQWRSFRSTSSLNLQGRDLVIPTAYRSPIPAFSSGPVDPVDIANRGQVGNISIHGQSLAAV